jgi:4-hydroxy 2-oxovalerate aldolase
MELLQAASEEVSQAKLTVLLIPGIGTVKDLERAMAPGATAVRVATHVTEADVSAQHISTAKEMGLFTVGFLMMVHMSEPEAIAEQAKLMESYGADYINLADSAGYLLPSDVASRIAAVKSVVDIPVGFHAHNNLSWAIANSMAAIDAGATYIDATLRGLGAGAGNTQLEVFTGVMQRMNLETGLDFYGLMDLAQDAVEPIMHRPQVIGTAPLIMGYAGVYSSFLLQVYRAGEKFNLEPRDILVELGKRQMVGGQEDMIQDVAFQLTQKK